MMPFGNRKKRYRDLFENAPVGVFRSTPDGEFLSVNPAMAQMLKCDKTRCSMTHICHSDFR
jgi:PAS domain-containing protein